MKIETVELNPRVWYRGKTGRASYLLSPRRIHGYRQQCCLGIACSATGVEDDLIRKRTGVEDLYAWRDDVPPKWLARLSELNGDHDLYDINDRRSTRISDSQRVRDLNKELKRLAIPLRFRLKARR
jgi:hypothetical protein